MLVRFSEHEFCMQQCLNECGTGTVRFLAYMQRANFGKLVLYLKYRSTGAEWGGLEAVLACGGSTRTECQLCARMARTGTVIGMLRFKVQLHVKTFRCSGSSSTTACVSLSNSSELAGRKREKLRGRAEHELGARRCT